VAEVVLIMKKQKLIFWVLIIVIVLFGLYLIWFALYTSDPDLTTNFSQVKPQWRNNAPFGISQCYTQDGEIYLEIMNNASEEKYPIDEFFLDKVIISGGNPTKEYVLEGAKNIGGTVGKRINRDEIVTLKVLECEDKYDSFYAGIIRFQFRYYSEHLIPEEQIETNLPFSCYCQ
jgi:hypothetical protein